MTDAVKPHVDVPPGQAPPTELVTEDLIEGTGAEAVTGKEVEVHYVGVAFSSGKEFDSSWNRREPFDFRLGAGQVIDGWDRGVAGMRVGGRRQLTIPARLAYGDRGAGGVIRPGETLDLVCEVETVRGPIGRGKVRASVGSELAVRGTLTFAVGDG